jgi:hypothetical protein
VKKPDIAGMFGKIEIEYAMIAISMLQSVAIMKELAGFSRILAATIGIVNNISDRPFDISSGVSANMNTMLIKISSKELATFPDQYLFI